MLLPWHESAATQLAQLIGREKLPHALLITGPAYSGLRRLGHWLQRSLLCLEPQQGRACMECRSCHLLSAGSHPDAYALHPEEDSTVIKVDAVRRLIHDFMLTTTISRYKAALIAPAEQMNVNAANALLKTLEEPLGQAVLILTSANPGRLLPTIRSRCQVVRVEPAQRNVTLQWLATRYSEHTEAQHLSAWQGAGGQPMLAGRYLAEDLLAVRQQVGEDLLALSRDKLAPADVAGRWLDFPLEDIWLWLGQWLMAGVQAQLTGQMPDAGPEAVGEILHAVEAADAEALLGLQRHAMHNRRFLDSPLRQDLLITDWLLKWRQVINTASV